MSESNVLPEEFYGRDPSMNIDALRRVERGMGGCDGCAHDITMLGLRGCVAGGKVDKDGYCGKRKAKGGGADGKQA